MGTFRPVEQHYSVDQMAKLLGVSPRTISRQIADGRLRHVLIGRQIRISAEDASNYLAQARR